MAFNLKTFQTRTLTAIIFAAIMLTGLLWNHWSFFILVAIIHFGCWWEYINLMEKINKSTIHRYTRLGFLLMGFAIMLWFCGPVFEINNYRLKENFCFPVSVAGFVMLGMGIFQKEKVNLKLFGFLVLGLVYISLCWGLMLGLFQKKEVLPKDFSFTIEGNFIPIVVIASIWINDTMAYIVGSLIGKTPLSKVSPKKTWEGTIGGIVLCVLLMGFLFTKTFYSFSNTSLNYLLSIIALIAAITGTAGDLIESKLKRMAGVKDSGNLMPGHGGFLDRFDSLLLAIPAVWLYVYFIIR